MQNSLCLRGVSNCTARDEVYFSGHDEISAKASTTASCKLEKTLTLSCRSTHLVAKGAARGGAEGARAAPLAIRILMVIS